MLYVFTDFLDLCAVNGVRREVKVAHLFFFFFKGAAVEWERIFRAFFYHLFCTW